MFWSCEKSWQVIKMLMRCRRTDNAMLERVEIPPCCMPQHLTLLNCVDIDVLKLKHVRCPLPSSAQAELSRGDDGGIPRPMSTYIAPEACYYLQREGRNQPSLYNRCLSGASLHKYQDEASPPPSPLEGHFVRIVFGAAAWEDRHYQSMLRLYLTSFWIYEGGGI